MADQRVVILSDIATPVAHGASLLSQVSSWESKRKSLFSIEQKMPGSISYIT